MVVDTSALLAVLFKEADADRYLEAMVDASEVRISAATAVALGIVAIGRAGADAELQIDLLLARVGAIVVPVDSAMANLARSAFKTFGKGRHRAKLNFGDCFSYALAKMTGEPLLYKGSDFAETDLKSAI